MKITFIENTRYSEDGFIVKKGIKGETRDVADTAARALLHANKAFRSDNPREIEKNMQRWNLATAQELGWL